MLINDIKLLLIKLIFFKIMVNKLIDFSQLDLTDILACFVEPNNYGCLW